MEWLVTVCTEITLHLPLSLKKPLNNVASARFRSPAHFLLPGGCPELASLLEVLTLLQLALSEVAAHHRVAVLIDAVGEVLAGHADHADFKSWSSRSSTKSHSSMILHSSTPVLLQVKGDWQRVQPKER